MLNRLEFEPQSYHLLTGKGVCVLLNHVWLCSDPMDCSPLGSSVHGILQDRILEWLAIPFSRGSPPPRDQTLVSCIVGWFFTIWATREEAQLGKLLLLLSRFSRVQLCATPWTAAYQAPLPMGFSRQEYWSRVPLPSPTGKLLILNFHVSKMRKITIFTS